jgi:hypothetical protein
VEQRDGRILRQGNENPEVGIYRYVTEGSFDAYMWQALETKAGFIQQVMTGDLSVRQAEDIGAAELSYAEVKAIASGNPAVLSLAEADAELKRLAVLKKHQADEQYLARRALRELPDAIARLERRMAGLAQDMATAQAHADDPLTIGDRICRREQAQEALAERLRTLPASVQALRHIPLGRYRGLNFGIALYPGHAPETYVEGEVTRLGKLAGERPGPRALLNAVERIVGGYENEYGQAAQDAQIARDRLRDYAARRDGTFAHAAYLEELTGLRDRLEAALAEPSGIDAAQTDALVERIRALKAAHSLEAAPERSASRQTATVAEAVTTRILHRSKAHLLPCTEPETAAEAISGEVRSDAEPPAPPADAEEPLLFAIPAAAVRQPKTDFRRRATRAPRQMRLF